jgi:precorrin-2/cobalt-factor-2 C20-methyltransferase
MGAGRLYGVGVGPGDPELMTLKAARILKAAPVLAFFRKKGRPGNGRTIVEGYLNEQVVEEALTYPLTTEVPAHDPVYAAALTAFYDDSAARLAAHLDAGRDVAAISEGDPFFYGSFMPIFHRLSARYSTEVVPGVTGMSGCWTTAGTPITYGDDVLTVVPGTLDADSLVNRLRQADAAVIMKLGRNLPKVRRALDDVGLLDRAIYVERGTMVGQKVTPLAEKDSDEAPYFSMIVVPGRGRLL